MDTKALAKSKRAHSLNNSKKHNHHQASKVPSISSGTVSGSKKPAGNQIKEKPQQSRGARTLPSNWDRYDEEFDLGSENTAQESTSQPSEFVVPKSKGSDYAHLIMEAKVQSQTNYPSDTSVSFSDVFDDFTQDFGPLLSAKGQSILSWIADDDFEFEEKASTSHEAPFLSLNLNTLAEQLAKSKPSERLFVESCLLPSELLDDELRTSSEKEHIKAQTCTSTVTIDDFGASPLGQNQEGTKNVLEDNEPVTSEGGLKSTKQISDEELQLQGTAKAILSNSNLKSDMGSTYGSQPIFEATNAEAELDMLLNSFSETSVLESSNASSTSILSPAAGSTGSLKKGAHIIESAVVPDKLDDGTNIFFEGTSDLNKIDVGQLSHGVKASSDIPSTLHPISKSKLMDDFDSWLDTI
ncbi:hypothetical protein ACJIZ3_018879 [Penstemon smallii]|uniref:Uncharacterized protein n=1 Tax=Penstemon smallii TaxID=265156 RepID=A0ABD3T127_9LAMI